MKNLYVGKREKGKRWSQSAPAVIMLILGSSQAQLCLNLSLNSNSFVGRTDA
jgi:hypothetical protein